ncbi:hypothetical protein GOV09_05085, partial [Candidatus Woesearchaeota archaeon]|nr:hypothetical protein [Candidatus Woesearchaeota archaeon]
AIFISVMAFMFYLSHKVTIPGLDWLIRNFGRENETPGSGFLYYLIGAEVVLFLFTEDIAIAALLILAVGDSIPNFVSMYFRQIKHPFSDRKYLEGMVAGIFFAFLAASLVVSWLEALVASVIALIVEGFDMKYGFQKIDDNLIIPFVAGLVIFLLRMFL